MTSAATSLGAMVNASAARALAFLGTMRAARSVWPSSRLAPADPTFLRPSVGAWAGGYTMPDNALNPALTYCPVVVQGPLWFPIAAGQEATFSGLVDLPWAGLDGFAAASWGPFHVVGACGGVRQFHALVGPSRSWSAVVPDPPSGTGWSFQLATYASPADAAADLNRRPIGAAWAQSDRPGDVRRYWNLRYSPPAAPLFTNVSNVPSGGHTLFSGDVDPARYGPRAGYHYKVLLTEEVDAEYAQIVFDLVANHFEQIHDYTFTGTVKLRLIEVSDLTGAPERHIGPVWDQNAALDPDAWLDLRVEYYAIGTTLPGFPTHAQPARRDHSWSFTHTTGAIGRARLVDINTKRVLGEYTMPSGLVRSYNVPAAEAGQSTASVYYDGFLDTCYLYDQAVSLIALLQQGDWPAAQHLIDALLLAQNGGGSWPFVVSQSILGADDLSLLRTGAIAWVVYALLIADQPEYRARWTTRTDAAATDGLKWIINNTLNSVGLFKGGFDASGATPWWSTEHNIDVWWCLDLADRLYGSADYNWRSYADGVKAGLLAHGWDAGEGIFWQGGGHTVDTDNDGAHALDMMTWGAVILEKWGQPADRDHAIARAYQKYYCTDDDYRLSGFCTFTEEDGYPPGTVKSPWCEGTFGAVLASRNVDPRRAFGLIATMARGQLADGSYRYTLKRDPIQPIETFPCAIGAAWNVLAWSGVETPNPRLVWT